MSEVEQAREVLEEACRVWIRMLSDNQITVEEATLAGGPAYAFYVPNDSKWQVSVSLSSRMLKFDTPRGSANPCIAKNIITVPNLFRACADRCGRQRSQWQDEQTIAAAAIAKAAMGCR